MRGLGRVYKRGEIYWIAYSHRGKEYRESSNSTREVDAKQFLKKRLGEIGKATFIGPQEERVYVDDLLKLVETDHQLHRRRSKSNQTFIKHIREHFGYLRAIDITPLQIDNYIQERLNQGKKLGTIGRELNVLKRAFRLGLMDNLITRMPHIKHIPDKNIRQGFFEYEELQTIMSYLPEHMKDFTLFAYLSGWRKGEISSLEWSDIDMKARVVRLRPENSKTERGRILALEGELWLIIQRRWKQRNLGCPFVFHREGIKLISVNKWWNKARQEAGLPHKLFHDFRRTAIRNMVRAGIPERIVMDVSGHRTRTVFDRYNIVNESDQRVAMQKVQNYIRELGQNSDNFAFTRS